jgi:glycosyltransferase involved in cell wall biosynthesis
VSFAGGLYGVERMTLNLAELLAHDASTAVFAPPGPIHGAARDLGLESIVFDSDLDLFQRFRAWVKPFDQAGAVTSSLRHALAIRAAALVTRRRIPQVSIVHGGNSDAESYGHKSTLLRLGVKVVAVSEYVHERLTAHGLAPGKVEVIENFLLPRERDRFPSRRPYGNDEAPTKGVVVSRFDTHKRLDVLADALIASRALRSQFTFQIVGGPGTASAALAPLFAELDGCVDLVGFDPDPSRRIARADFLLHLCPSEAFGMVVLEAMACAVPVVVPGVGGAGCLVVDGVTGLIFDPRRPGELERALAALAALTPAELNGMTARASELLETRFNGSRQREQLLALLE